MENTANTTKQTISPPASQKDVRVNTPPSPSQTPNEPSNSKNTTKRRPWPDKRRAQQAKNCQKTRPERFATGPKTTKGKAASSQNAYKHGLKSSEILKLKKLVKQQKGLLKAFKT